MTSSIRVTFSRSTVRPTVQWLFGDNLLGEALLTSAFIAAGTVLVFVLARRVSASSITALAAAAFAYLLFPRAYDYDKVLFYPLGILLLWRYLDKPSVSRLWALAAGAVVSSLYRYDTGIFIAGAAVVAMAVLHSGDWATLARRLAYFGMALGCLALPFLVFVQFSGGVVNAVDQMLVYGRRETARTRLSIRPRLVIPALVSVADVPPPGSSILIRWAPQVDDKARIDAESRHGLLEGSLRGQPADRTWAYRILDSSTGHLRGLLSDPLVEDTDGIDRAELTVPSEPLWVRAQRALPLLRVRFLPGTWNVSNADAFLYGLFRFLPLVAGFILIGTLRQPSSASRVEIALVASVIALSVALNAFILRDPVSARFGGMAAPTAILAAWTVHRALQLRLGIARRVLTAALVVGFAATVWSTSVSAEWSSTDAAGGVPSSSRNLSGRRAERVAPTARAAAERRTARDRQVPARVHRTVLTACSSGGSRRISISSPSADSRAGRSRSSVSTGPNRDFKLAVCSSSRRNRFPSSSCWLATSCFLRAIPCSCSISMTTTTTSVRPTLTMRGTVAEDIASWFVAIGEPIACTR